jgi:hypothetical protein
MAYSKPQVTIDLEEYNELLRLKSDEGTLVKTYDKFVRKLLMLLSNQLSSGTNSKEHLVMSILKINGYTIVDQDGIIKFRECINQ